ncbi:MAG: efflux RND transporter periplasmic adaptor subunit [Deltaproteobacteria bacterium]|nr:efflux RND transporter periplasmic adaptor subunit [Deltaproteobacteria bacterium]
MNRAILAAKAVVPILVLVVGFGVFRFLVVTKAEAPRAAPPPAGALVEVTSVSAEDRDVTLRAHGRVIPTRQVRLSSQVGGRVVWQDQRLSAGGRFNRGEPMLRVDPRDYQLALESQRADVERASVEVDLERSRRDIATREWQSFGPADAGTDAGTELALRQPQERAADLNLMAARSGLRRARLELSRTTIRAPFDLLVLTEEVDLGQLVGPSAPLITAVSSESFRVQVAVPLEALARIQLPRGGQPGASADILLQAGETRIERRGRVLSVLPDVAPTGSLARLLIQIDEPLGREQAPGELPLLLGSYVEVRIAAGSLSQVIPVPREQIHEGDHVYVLDANSRLDIRHVRIDWREQNEVLIGEGLEPGERIVTSRLATPVTGTLLRLATGPQVPAEAAQP